jgi:fatty acid desaturase
MHEHLFHRQTRSFLSPLSDVAILVLALLGLVIPRVVLFAMLVLVATFHFLSTIDTAALAEVHFSLHAKFVRLAVRGTAWSNGLTNSEWKAA